VQQERFFGNNDLYTYTVKRVVWERFSNVEVEYSFRNRDAGIDLLPHKDAIRSKIQDLNGLAPDEAFLGKLRGLKYLSDPYLEALSQARLDTSHIEVGEKDGKLDIRIRGPWFQTIDFEVPVLQIVNETYFESFDSPQVREEGDRRLTEKIKRIKEFVRDEVLPSTEAHPYGIIEMGTRRAFAFDWHGHVLERLANELPEALLGTSNVYWATKLGLRTFGTFSHQGPMAMQALYPIHQSQRIWFEIWNEVFRGNLGIALSDTLGSDLFFRDFDLALAKLYDGARHDSGDPFEWGERFIAHLSSMKIDANRKTAVFSDSLDDRKSFEIWRRFAKRIRVQFGIGTFLANDLGPKPLSNVIKLVGCNGFPVAKLSDDPRKGQCEDPLVISFMFHLVNDLVPKMGRP
jgi:nicotinate phosphoribosyltransferase